jgi:hypothetical protein
MRHLRINETGYIEIFVSNRMMSLWQMLQFEAKSLLSAISFVGGCIGDYHALVRVSDNVTGLIAKPTLEAKAQIISAVQEIQAAAKRYGMKTTIANLNMNLPQLIDRLSPNGPLYPSDMARIASILESVLSSFIAEAEGRKFFAMTDSLEGFQKSADDLFGPDVIDGFPSSEQDIKEAGKCLSFELWTASVMHLMRVSELGLQALADHVGVLHEDNWNKTLNLIEGKLREVRKKVDGPSQEQWAAEVGTHFRFVKNAWRNHAVHPNAHYDEMQARTIFENTKALMKQLAKQLKTYP